MREMPQIRRVGTSAPSTTLRRQVDTSVTTELLGGLIVSDAAIVLACNLEARGHALSSDRGVLKVSNGAQLSAEDIAAIRRLRHHLLAIAGYSGLRTNDTMSEWPERDSSALSAESNSSSIARKRQDDSPIARGNASEHQSAMAQRSSVHGATRRSTADSESRISASASTSFAHASAMETIASPDGRRIRRKARNTNIASLPNLFSDAP